MTATVISFSAIRRGADLVREVAAGRGYCRITQHQLARTFRPDDQRPLRVQASQHVPMPHQSATAGDVA